MTLGVKVSQNGGEKRGTLKSIYSVFANPIAVFLYSLLFALLSLGIVDVQMRSYAVMIVGTSYVLVSVGVAIWNEKISARRAQDENQKLKRQVDTLQTERNSLQKERDELEQEVPQVIEYSSVKKSITLKDAEGNAHFFMSYTGKSVSEGPVDKVRHFLTTAQKVQENRLAKAKFNNEDIHPRIEYTEWIKNGKSTWKNDIYFETCEPVQRNEPLDTSYEAELEKEYPEAFKDNGLSITLHEVSVKTDRFLVEIAAPDGFYFKNPLFDVRDMFSDIEIFQEKTRMSDKCMPTPKQDRKKIVWDIPYPKLSYRYILKFSLEKSEEKKGKS
jgi:hypothetical protein